ncbi:MAG TPA: S41 family peptidase [Gemmatimonadaceae bacterium]|nr:S41 family peptidase [Gemmatimonadaceae bacterium]
MKRLLCLVFALPLLSLPAQDPATEPGTLGFYRFPAVHGETIVFAAEGDLWSVSIEGGLARRLTSHAAEESDPVISPDGRLLAFTARYEGPAEVYTMPLAGGMPTRRTYDGESAFATTWTPDGKLVYTTTRYSGIPKPALVQIDLRDGTRTLVPLSGASEAAYDGAGRSLYFVRPAFHNNVTKRYTGGTARDVWKFADGADEAVELTGDYNGESHSPMWWNGRVYFVSDRDGTMNLWSMDERGGDVRQLTHHSGWDVRDPSLSAGRIVYQLGADLQVFDIASAQTRLVPITLQSDLDQLRENWVREPMQYLTSAHLSADGSRVALTSRGRVFVAPAKAGRFVRASRKDSVRFRDAVFMPDGKSLVALSDESGEFEFTRVPANGVGTDTPLTRNGTVLRFRGNPSPDGKMLAWTDNNRDLFVMSIADGEPHLVSENREGVGDLSWSPDSRWLAYVMTARNTFQQIKLYSVESGRSTAVTSDRVNSMSPAWSPDGAFLYFLSDRNLQTLVGAPWGARQPEPYFDKEIEVYSVALRAGMRSPFQPPDELHRAPERRDSARNARPNDAQDDDRGDVRDDAQVDSRAAAVPPIRIDLDGLALRVRKVPVPSGNYGWLALNGDALFMTSRGSGADANTDLVAVRISNDPEPPLTVVDDIRSAELSANGRKLLLRKGQGLYVIDAKPAKVAKLEDARVDLSDWAFPIDVRQDWRQIFVDAWRLERDWFYDPAMHGVDYEATRDKYLPLVDRITTRDELSDLIGWAVGELSALHTSVRGGDMRRGEEAVRVASLGARLFRDPSLGGYRIDYIYQSDPDYPDERSPLADPALGIHAGDVITAVNGVATMSVDDIGALLRNQVDKQVLVTVKARSGKNSRDIIVTPIANERDLRYADWEYTRRLATDERSDGRIGYVHLRAMGGSDVNAWYRQFYPVFNRQGLVLDMRQNRGGNIDSWILEKLMRRAWMYWQDRVGEPYWNMNYAFRGHMVVLVDQETASDGEAFAEGFRRLGLGPVIGARTWGGEIWLSSANALSDNGLARAPMSGVYGPEGKWLIEQEGVIPDIVVDNLPHATFEGRDAQLDAAIEWLEKKIAEDPRAVPEPPAYPVRAFRYPDRR